MHGLFFLWRVENRWEPRFASLSDSTCILRLRFVTISSEDRRDLAYGTTRSRSTWYKQATLVVSQPPAPSPELKT